MKKLSTTAIQLIKLLGDGKYHHGKNLGDKLSISRAAVSKHIKHMRELGVAIEVGSVRGYQLSTPFTPLEEDSIRKHCPPPLSEKLEVDVFAQLPSTNDYLKSRPNRADRKLHVCLSEEQTAGRGRLGRQWHSPFGANIYCSVKWHFEGHISRLSGLSLVVGLALKKSLGSLSIDGLAVKWPNDIFLNGRKLAGILIDIQAESHGGADVIIGFGINVNMSEDTSIETAWTSLYQASGQTYDRNILIGHCFESLVWHLEKFKQEGLAGFLSDWESADLLKGKNITIQQHHECFEGQADGIDADGNLKLIMHDGKTVVFSSGDASLHSGYTNSAAGSDPNF